MALSPLRWRSTAAAICTLLAIQLLGAAGAGAVLSPFDGGGNFHTYVDVINRWQDDGRLDVLVLVEVANADLTCEREAGGYVGRLLVEARLVGPDGREVVRKHQVRTPFLSEADATSPTLHQVFGVILADVPFRQGRFECQVNDVNRKRAGVLNSLQARYVRSECAGDWFADDGPRPPRGVALGDPLYLLQAPLAEWNPANLLGREAEGDWLHDYAHPSRRYGIEQDRLQIFVPVWPAAGGLRDEADLVGLRLQAVSREMDFALNDTIYFDQRGRAALMAGRPAALFYELDVNLLPEGVFRLSLAPLGAEGRGQLSEFTVQWRLGALARLHELALGEGRTVFYDERLDAFLAASPAEREEMLDRFWDEHDPDPESPLNEAHLEFQYRLAYVQRFLGGFDAQGARDARGEVFLLLGPPDEVQRNPLPSNFREQDDARIKVYDRWAPDREGSWAKGSAPGGTQSISPYETEGGIPMPYSHRAEIDRSNMVGSAQHQFAFELWRYDNGGKSLFLNRLSDKGMGQRFLFVDRSGAGQYELESSNVVQGEE